MALPGSRTTKTIRVLVVDDSTSCGKPIERHPPSLGRNRGGGHRCDGADGVKQALALRPDVITMDVEMPRMDGVTAVREIVQRAADPDRHGQHPDHAGADTDDARSGSRRRPIRGQAERLLSRDLRRRQHRTSRRRCSPRATPRPHAIAARRASAARQDVSARTFGTPIAQICRHRLLHWRACRARAKWCRILPADARRRCPRSCNTCRPASRKRSPGGSIALPRSTLPKPREGDVVEAGVALVAPGHCHIEVSATTDGSR